MQEIVKDTDWQIKEFIAPEQANYFAVITKKSSWRLVELVKLLLLFDLQTLAC